MPEVTKPLGLRDRAILETFYSTGLRRMELANLGVYDLDAERGTLMIRQGKGKKDRVVPIGERAVAWIEKYRQEARPELLAARTRHTSSSTSWGVDRPRPALDPGPALRRRARVGKTVLPPLPSHAGDRDARGRRRRPVHPGDAGHERLDTTQVYTQVSIRALKAIDNATHPAARLKKKEPPTTSPRPFCVSGPRIQTLLSPSCQSSCEGSNEAVMATAAKIVFPHRRRSRGTVAARPAIDDTRVRVNDVAFLAEQGLTSRADPRALSGPHAGPGPRRSPTTTTTADEIEAELAAEDQAAEDFERRKAELLAERAGR